MSYLQAQKGRYLLPCCAGANDKRQKNALFCSLFRLHSFILYWGLALRRKIKKAEIKVVVAGT
jgi:hypothetical protein